MSEACILFKGKHFDWCFEENTSLSC